MLTVFVVIADFIYKFALVICAVGNFYFAYKNNDSWRLFHIFSGLLALWLLFS